MWSLLASFLAELRGMRRALLTLAILFLVIVLLEVDLGHRPAIAQHEAWLALVPSIWLPISLMALMALQLFPSLFTVITTQVTMAIATIVGMVGSGAHILASGATLAHPDRLFSIAVWGGPQSPIWPVGITMAAALGLIASLGAHRDSEPLHRDIGGVATGIAFALILAGIGFAAVPWALMVSATSFVLAALLLLAVIVGMLASAAMERSTP
jgi:hypothetical protein